MVLNKDKTDSKKAQTQKKAKNSAVSNPLTKQINSLTKPSVKEPVVNHTQKTISDPITQDTSKIIAKINNFNTNKTSNKIYGNGLMNENFHKVIDYSDIIYSLNSVLSDKTNVRDLCLAIHDLFIEKLNHVFTAIGLYHEKSKCINMKLDTSMGNIYTSKIFMSDEKNPVIECFNKGEPVFCDNNKFLNIPYMRESSSLILPLIAIGGCKGVMVIGKNDIENRVGLFAFIANYCALFIQNLELVEQTNKYANTDTLTGLYTHRGFQEVLSSELKRASDNNTELSIIMLDINNISKINRELGHAKGDEVIKLLAEKVKQNIRSTDKAGRYGGDEIAIVLPDTNTADAKYLAEYITYCLSCCFVDDVGPVKVSVGIATFPECSREQEKLLLLAEQATYISQAKGYKEGMSAIVSSSDFNFWDDDALNSFAEVVAKRHSQLGVNFEEELVHKFNNEQIVSQNHLMELAYSLTGAIEAKDPYTKGHSTSVSRYSEALARAINLPEDEVQRIKLGALLHDVGKIGIPENVLKKPDKLSDDEWEIMKQHPVIGAEKVLGPNEALRDLIPIVKYHHERIDGKGYPNKLKGDEIPLGAKIVAVADTFHALISDRPYRKGLSVDTACKILKEGEGKQWDADLIRHFIGIAPALSTSI
jgi:diguanylate cyclase (GGDEF)-like protein/putative nucleotidyltransferase with HDIG domain